MLLWALSSTALGPCASAVPVGAQIWLREPVSDTASVVMWRPCAMARRVSSAAKGSIRATPQ